MQLSEVGEGHRYVKTKLFNISSSTSDIRVSQLPCVFGNNISLPEHLKLWSTDSGTIEAEGEVKVKVVRKGGSGEREGVWKGGKREEEEGEGGVKKGEDEKGQEEGDDQQEGEGERVKKGEDQQGEEGQREGQGQGEEAGEKEGEEGGRKRE